MAEDPLAQAKIDLVEKAKKDGKIEQRDIFAKIADTPDNVALLDQLYTELADSNIKIVEPAGSAAAGLADKWTAEDDEEIVIDEKTYMDDIADDSVRLYLREIGKIPLLTAPEELALAQRVVAGEKRAAVQLRVPGEARRLDALPLLHESELEHLFVPLPQPWRRLRPHPGRNSGSRERKAAIPRVPCHPRLPSSRRKPSSRLPLVSRCPCRQGPTGRRESGAGAVILI